MTLSTSRAASSGGRVAKWRKSIQAVKWASRRSRAARATSGDSGDRPRITERLERSARWYFGRSCMNRIVV